MPRENWLLPLCVLLAGARIAMAAPEGLVYVRLDAGDLATTESSIQHMEALGIIVSHTFPPDQLIVRATETQVPALKTLPGVIDVVSEKDREELLTRGDQLPSPARVFTYMTDPARTQEHPTEGRLSAGGCLLRPSLPPGFDPSLKQRRPLVSSVSLYTAEYMVGRVALVVILMESAGNAENWTPDKEAIAMGEIVQGADWLSSQAEQHGVHLTWVYEFHTGVPTSYEPIEEQAVPYYSYVYPPLSWEFKWIDDALSYLGSGSEWDGVFNLANTRRATYKADWAYEVYVVMDDNDADRMFSDEKCAYYAPYYECCDPTTWPPLYEYPSPLVVMAYMNCDWGYQSMDRVFAHETGHVFGAGDEYSASDCECDEEYGYLHVANGNCQVCNPASAPCVMRNNEPYVCSYSAGQFGWYDSDGDGPVDAIDPNYPRWASIYPVHLGDVVHIFTLGGDLVKTIACSLNNIDTLMHEPGQDWTAVVWDAMNNWGYGVGPGPYLVTVNGGDPFTKTASLIDPAIKPKFVEISYANGYLSWELDSSYAQVRLFLYDEDDGSLIARPIWDQKYSAYPTDLHYSTPIDTSGCRGPVIARFFGWRTGRCPLRNDRVSHLRLPLPRRSGM